MPEFILTNSVSGLHGCIIISRLKHQLWNSWALY